MILASKSSPKNGTKWNRFLNLVNRKKVFHRKSHPQHLVPQECGLHEKKCEKLMPKTLGELPGKYIPLCRKNYHKNGRKEQNRMNTHTEMKIPDAYQIK